MIPWNHDVILWNRVVILWNHAVIPVFAARSLTFPEAGKNDCRELTTFRIRVRWDSGGARFVYSLQRMRRISLIIRRACESARAPINILQVGMLIITDPTPDPSRGWGRGCNYFNECLGKRLAWPIVHSDGLDALEGRCH